MVSFLQAVEVTVVNSSDSWEVAAADRTQLRSFHCSVVETVDQACDLVEKHLQRKN